MTPSTISRSELRKKMLAAVREEPGCENVKEISITALEDVDNPARDSWRVSIVDDGGAKTDAAYNAANRVTEKFVKRYRLADD